MSCAFAHPWIWDKDWSNKLGLWSISFYHLTSVVLVKLNDQHEVIPCNRVCRKMNAPSWERTEQRKIFKSRLKKWRFKIWKKQMCKYCWFSYIISVTMCSRWGHKSCILSVSEEFKNDWFEILCDLHVLFSVLVPRLLELHTSLSF